jgi:hypothetical protein
MLKMNYSGDVDEHRYVSAKSKAIELLAGSAVPHDLDIIADLVVTDPSYATRRAAFYTIVQRAKTEPDAIHLLDNIAESAPDMDTREQASEVARN